jgi:transposase-like protein
MASLNGFPQHNRNGSDSASGEQSPQLPEGSSADRLGQPAAEPDKPDPQMIQKATRRRFTSDYKLSIMAKADTCTGPGEVGALLRQEGIFSSTLANFRKQKNQGLLRGSAPKARASKHLAVAEALAQQTQYEREIRALRRKLAHAERIIAIQKKAAVLLGETLQDMNLDDRD